MIQPVSAFSPRAGFRGTNGAYGVSEKAINKADIALINASGLAALAGGVTTAVSRAYTQSWGAAALVGAFGSFLTLIFMTPSLIENSSKKNLKNKVASDAFIKAESPKAMDTAAVHLKPVKKLIPFRQQS